MNLTVNTELVISKLTKMIKIIPKKVVIPITECILFQVSGGRMVMTVNNGLIQITTEIMVDSAFEFTFCVPYELLFHTLRLIGERDVEILMDEQHQFGILIKAEKKKYKIAGYDPSTFIIMRKPTDEGGYMIVDSQTFREAVSIAGRFVNNKDPREAFRGVSVSIHDNKALLYSTDGYSMSRVCFKIDNHENWAKIIVPSEICPLITDIIIQTEQLSVSQNGRIVRVKSKDYDITCLLIDANYPNCDQFFQPMTRPSITLSRSEIDQALAVLKLYTADVTNILVFDMVNHEKLILSAEDDSKDNKGFQVINMGVFSGAQEAEPVKTGFNINFFINTLAAITTSDFKMWVDPDPKKHSRIKPDHGEDPVLDTEFVLMPMSLTN